MIGHSENEESSDRKCDGVSPSDENCRMPATVHCVNCDLWFCDIHAEDEIWHACMAAENNAANES